MGTKSHPPQHGPAVPDTGHAHDADARPLGPGVRPNTRSLLLEARERMAERAAKAAKKTARKRR